MKKGEVWKVNLNPTIGDEIKKSRPCVIVSNDMMGKLPLKIVVPLTGWKDSFDNAPWHVKVNPSAENGLSKTCSADTFQVRSISDQRLVKKLGFLPRPVVDQIESGLAVCLDLD
ncbi:MAG: type II toxin-antitoxin system PemK/MazF family toxin [Anaerolineales bacterium]|nr:type II toxin-antitoxin system PemK/MazF family toxin [Anaerolineales bacterium]